MGPQDLANKSPRDLADISISGSTTATGINLFGDLFKGISGFNQYGYQAGIAQMKEKIAKQNADYAVAAGETQAGIYGLKAKTQMGQIIAKQGASNIDVGSGSSRTVQESQHIVSQMDMAQIRANAARKAYGYDVEAAGDEATARAMKMAGNNSLASIPFNMASSLITGSTSVASKWLQAKQYGIYGSNTDNSFYAPDDL